MRAAVLGLSALAVSALAAGVVVHGGWVDVAASQRHPPWLEAVLHYGMERSVQRHARGIRAPGAREEDAEAGLADYRAMCETCHGAPGAPPSEIAEGLYPPPPQFAEADSERTDAELFWITKHGIQLTGMPAFGATHGDEELWNIVAVVKQLPDMNPQTYLPPAPAERAPDPGEGHHDHHHH